MNKICGIYKITSKVHPERCYIGSAVVIKNRWSEHKRLLWRGEHNKPLQNHYDKYGYDDLIFILIEECIPENLIKREQFHLDADIHNGYFNVCKTAGNCLGIKQSEETKLKRRLANLGTTRPPFSEEHCRRISESRIGDKNPNWGKSSGMKGKIPWNKGLKMTEEYKERNKPKYIRPTLSEGVKKSWIKRKDEGKVGNRDKNGKFIKSK